MKRVLIVFVVLAALVAGYFVGVISSRSENNRSTAPVVRMKSFRKLAELVGSQPFDITLPPGSTQGPFVERSFGGSSSVLRCYRFVDQDVHRQIVLLSNSDDDLQKRGKAFELWVLSDFVVDYSGIDDGDNDYKCDVVQVESGVLNFKFTKE